jgi:phosphoglycolate phosphatase-like HAD superfamily hydrolase
MEKLGHTKDVLYVGDSVTDAEAARRAGLPFVAVLSGVTLRDAFDNPIAQPCAIVRDLDGLVAWLER